LLIAIFALMLVSVVAIALVVSTGTDSALASNYRSASSAYYAAMAGLEEARGRLLWKSPVYLGTPFPNLFNSVALPTFSLTQVVYVLNDPTGTTVIPQSGNPAYYADTEYAQEFSWGLGGAQIYNVNSMSYGPGTPGPYYRWVRINPVTEQSLNIDVNGNGILDGAATLFYDPAHLDSFGNPAPGLVLSSPPGTAPTPTAVQVLEVTAYAVLPNGGTRMLQYLVAPLVISSMMTTPYPTTAPFPLFPAPLTLDTGLGGNSVTFNPPSGYLIKGVDQCSSPPSPQLPNAVSAIALTNSTSESSVSASITAAGTQSNYSGYPLTAPPPPPGYTPTAPSLANVGGSGTPYMRQTWLQPQYLDALMQDIVNSADVILGPTGTYPPGGTFNAYAGTDLWNAAPQLTTNPMVVVVNGDLTLNGLGVSNPVGNGLLLVTGTLTYHPSAQWNGIILVVGQGQLVLAGSNNSEPGIFGSVFVAATRNSSGNLLTNPTASVTGGGIASNIQYNSCNVQTASGPITYKVISFHEIPLS
jgi:hypothetical protein